MILRYALKNSQHSFSIHETPLTTNWRAVRSSLFTHREPSEGHLDVGIDQVPGLAPEGVLQVGHDGGVHPGESVSSVYPAVTPVLDSLG